MNTKRKQKKSVRKVPLNKSRVPRSVNQKIHEFKVFTATPGGNSSIANTISVQESFWEFAFKLTDLPNATDFTNLFDQFRITNVELEIINTQQLASNVSSASTARGAILYSIIDNDDIGTPASINEMRQYETCKLHAGKPVYKRKVKPAVLVQDYETSIATAYTPKFNVWLSTSDSGTQHFGMKIGMYVIDVTNATNSIIYMLSARYSIECKNSK